MSLKIALVQSNPTIGDVEGNLALVRRGVEQAHQVGANLVVFPEQTLLGYPAKDLLLRRDMIDRNLAALEQLLEPSRQIAILLGYAERNTNAVGRPLYNAAALLHGGRVAGRWFKRLLPTYDVFDEARYFEPGGPQQPVVELHGRRIGVTICEDMWSREEMLGQPLYRGDPLRDLAQAGAQILFNLSASPYFLDKHAFRLELLSGHARANQVPLVFVNQVGGNDELLFDGSTSVADAEGNLVGLARAFEEDLLLVSPDALRETRCEPQPSGMAALHDALAMGLRDYVRKCGFRDVLIGLSGGIDSAVVAALAVAALGPEHVLGVAMPSRFSSAHSLADARELADRLGIRLLTVPIEPMHAAFEAALRAEFGDRPPDVAEENIQARVRGTIVMALSNKFGSLLLTTGNKSELAVGYCTLYGDMAGGLAVISDVPKTMVYDLARYINSRGKPGTMANQPGPGAVRPGAVRPGAVRPGAVRPEAVGSGAVRSGPIPSSTLTKPPSAELREKQTDQDSLPPYEILDEILERYDVQLQSPAEIVAAGFDPQTVARVVRLIQSSEYKRRQAAPGLKVTSRAFGFGRRMPIAARYPS